MFEHAYIEVEDEGAASLSTIDKEDEDKALNELLEFANALSKEEEIEIFNLMQLNEEQVVEPCLGEFNANDSMHETDLSCDAPNNLNWQNLEEKEEREAEICDTLKLNKNSIDFRKLLLAQKDKQTFTYFINAVGKYLIVLKEKSENDREQGKALYALIKKILASQTKDLILHKTSFEIITNQLIYYYNNDNLNKTFELIEKILSSNCVPLISNCSSIIIEVLNSLKEKSKIENKEKIKFNTLISKIISCQCHELIKQCFEVIFLQLDSLKQDSVDKEQFRSLLFRIINSNCTPLLESSLDYFNYQLAEYKKNYEKNKDKFSELLHKLIRTKFGEKFKGQYLDYIDYKSVNHQFYW